MIPCICKAAKSLRTASARATTAASGRSPRQPLAAKLVKIVLPVLVTVAAELEQVVPAKDAGRMQVVEHQPHGVIADRDDFQNRDIALAADGLALLRRMALHLGARAAHAQIFRGKLET